MPPKASRSRLVIVALGLTLAACDPALVIRGNVRDAQHRPAANAVVQLRCGTRVDARTSSDADGGFRFHLLGWRPDTCVLEIARDRATPFAIWPIMPYCVKKHGDHACLEIAGVFQLP